MSYDWDRKTLEFDHADTREFLEVGEPDENEL